MKLETAAAPKPEKAASSEISLPPAKQNPPEQREARRTVEPEPPAAEEQKAEKPAQIAPENEVAVAPPAPVDGTPGPSPVQVRDEQATAPVVVLEESPTPTDSKESAKEIVQPNDDKPSEDTGESNGTNSPSIQTPPLSPDEAPVVLNSAEADSAKASPPAWTGNLPLVPSDPDDAAEAAP